MKKYPIYEIRNFKCSSFQENIYINKISNHITEHGFINQPHGHVFYLIMLFNAGTGKHWIDFQEYPVKKGSFFIIQPGQIHHWELSKEVDGYIIFITKEIYNLYFQSKKIQNYPLFVSSSNISFLDIEKDDMISLEYLMELILKEYILDSNTKRDKIINLIDCILIDMSVLASDGNYIINPYNLKLNMFYELVEKNFVIEKKASFYAKELNITPKHLNRICKSLLNKTASHIITERIILEAKRLLIDRKLSISNITEQLGFFEMTHFAKFFKKHTVLTATEFRLQYYQNSINI
ncbi:hypothetical protein AD998_09240 [bacterium 336/3]|nr:hypothetical protein AD998_09240 [bacterium 336/3]